MQRCGLLSFTTISTSAAVRSVSSRISPARFRRRRSIPRSTANVRLADLVPAARVRTTFLQHLPEHDRYFRALAPLYPFAFESLDLRAYDLIISSTTAWAKGVIARPRRRARLLHQHREPVRVRLRALCGWIRGRPVGASARARIVAWDKRAAQRPTLFVANSHNVAARIRQLLRSRLEGAAMSGRRRSLHRWTGRRRLLRAGLAVCCRTRTSTLRSPAARQAGVPLQSSAVVRPQAALRERAAGTRTVVHGYVDDRAVDRIVGNARAAILPGTEDFGLVPLEAAAAGRPTIALARRRRARNHRRRRNRRVLQRRQRRLAGPTLRDFDPARYAPTRLRAHAETLCAGPLRRTAKRDRRRCASRAANSPSTSAALKRRASARRRVRENARLTSGSAIDSRKRRRPRRALVGGIDKIDRRRPRLQAVRWRWRR